MGWYFQFTHFDAFARGINKPTIALTYAEGRLGIGSIILNPYMCMNIEDAEYWFERHHYRPRFYEVVVDRYDRQSGMHCRIVSAQIAIMRGLPLNDTEEEEPTLFSPRINGVDYAARYEAQHAPTKKHRRRR